MRSKAPDARLKPQTQEPNNRRPFDLSTPLGAQVRNVYDEFGPTTGHLDLSAAFARNPATRTLYLFVLEAA